MTDDRRAEAERLIRERLDQGWRWAGDRLVHPSDPELFMRYDRSTAELVMSPKLVAFVEGQFRRHIQGDGQPLGRGGLAGGLSCRTRHVATTATAWAGRSS